MKRLRKSIKQVMSGMVMLVALGIIIALLVVIGISLLLGLALD